MGKHEDLEQYNRAQINIFNDPIYKEKVKKQLNKENPTIEEIVSHYIKSGDAEKFSKEHSH